MARVYRSNGRPPESAISCDSGQSMAEYIIIAVLVAIIVIVAVRKFGGGVSNQVSNATQIVASVQDDSGENVSAQRAAADRSPKEQDGDAAGFRDSDSGRSSGGGDNSGDSLRAEGVGTSSYTPIESVRIDWSIITMLAAAVVLAGMGVVVYLRRRTPKGEKKQKKSKVKAVKPKTGKAG